MKIAMIGLGKMGANMVRRLAGGQHEIVVYDVSQASVLSLAEEIGSVTPCTSLQQLVEAMPAPRAIWMMVPHQFVDSTIASLLEAGVSHGDVLIDGGNSNYKESQRRAGELSHHGVRFVDCGTSGGIWGLQNGYSMMLGGDHDAIGLITPALATLAPTPETGWGHVGPVGAGHYTKMVHNGIEYGMMQAFAEGFELIHDKPDMELDLKQITSIWQHGSVVRSWLLDILADAMQQDEELSSLSDYVDDSGEGRWTVEESIEHAIPAPVLTLALQMRYRSRQQDCYAGKVLNALRAGFGGHPIKPAD